MAWCKTHERRAARHPTPLTRSHGQAFCLNPLILLILPGKQRGWSTTQKGGDRQQVHTAGAPRFRKLNHITLFITHEITGCQYSSHGLPDYCCLRSCQSSPAILPSKFTQSYFQAVVSRVIALPPFLWHRNRKTKLLPSPFILAFYTQEAKGPPCAEQELRYKRNPPCMLNSGLIFFLYKEQNWPFLCSQT